MTITFADITTMRVGGPVGRLVVATSADDAVEVIRDCDERGEPVLIMGGGSNLVVGDVGWDGTVVRMATSEVTVDGERLTAAAGFDWDRLVALSLAEGLAGLEALSGIPGSVGGTPIQNVGAYGALTSDVLEQLTVYDRQTREVATWGVERCGFGSHRQSVFKRNNRWLVLDVTYRLRRSTQSAPVAYLELAKALDVPVGASAPVADVRAAVLGLRRGKKMLLDPDDHDTWSVGSFFNHPILSEVPARAKDCPQYPDVNGTKLSAGWLIQHAGFPPGYGRDRGNGRVALSSRHALAVTNRGGATTADVMEFAAHIREGVEAQFDIRLGPECDLVNCTF